LCDYSIALWLDAGLTEAKDSTKVRVMGDKSVENNYHINPWPQYKFYWPEYRRGSEFNDQPTFYFDGLQWVTGNAYMSGNEAIHVFGVSKVKDNGWRAVYGFNRDQTHVQWYNNGAPNSISAYLAPNANQIPSPAAADKMYGVTGWVYPKNGAVQGVRFNGAQTNLSQTTTNYTYSTQKVSIGGDVTNDGYGLSEMFYIRQELLPSMEDLCPMQI
jgi:hypothetical protein